MSARRGAVAIAVVAALGLAVLATAAPFGPSRDYPVGSEPLEVAAGDVNGDRLPDLVVGNRGDGTVSVLRGKPNGAFRAQQVHAAGDDPLGVALADFDRDGDKDVAVAHQSGTGGVSVLRNAGGDLSAPKHFGDSTDRDYVFAARLNGDRKLDLAAFGTDNVEILLGNGSGGFNSIGTVSIPGSAFGGTLADVDRDGDKDIVAGEYDADRVAIELNNGKGVFDPGGQPSACDGPNDIAAARLDGDKTLDLAVACYNGDQVAVLRGRPAGGYRMPELLDAKSSPAGIVAFRYNADSRNDLAVTVSDTDKVLVFRGKQGGFRRPLKFAVGSGPYGLVAAKLAGGKAADLAAAAYDEPAVSVLSR